MSLDITDTLAPKSDQINADDVAGRSVVVTVAGVEKIAGEQPLAVHLHEFPGRPWKPGKTVRRILAAAWGTDAAQWTGRRAEIYTDAEVTFGKAKVGGIRISRMSHLDKPLSLALTATRGKKQTHTIQPLPDSAPSHEVQPDWQALIVEAGDDVAALRAMWTDAQARGASEAILNDIKNAATAMGGGGARDGDERKE